MNRFAALDSDNEDEPKVASVTTDKKKKETAAAAPAAASNTASAKPAAGKADAAPKKANNDNKGKSEGKKDGNKQQKAPVPGQKNDKPKPKPAPAGDAAPAAGGEVMEASGSGKGEKRDNRNYGRGPRTRFEKRQDEKDPSIKPDNRIRGGAHSFNNNKRRSSKNTDKAEVDGLAKEGEKNPLGTETTEPVEAEAEEAAPETTPEVPAEPEPTTLSLDEYLRQREQARANSALLGQTKTARVVEELTGLKIKEDDEAGVYTGAAKSSKNSKANQRSTAKNVVVDLGFKIEDEQPQRTTGSRDDKRAPQAGRTGGNNNNNNNRSGPKSKGTRVDLADVNAFPSL